MAETKVINVEIFLEETSDKTSAEAVMEVGGARFGGWGRARRNPADPDIPQIGIELATARSLSDLSHKLLDAAAGAIELYEGGRVRVHD